MLSITPTATLRIGHRLAAMTSMSASTASAAHPSHSSRRRPPRRRTGRPCAATSHATRRSSGRAGPRLAHEWIAGGRVLPPADGVDDAKEVIVFLHGLLGNSKNLRTPAKKLTRKLPNLNALLLDVRGHGNSSNSSSTFAQPHDFRSCVRDVVDTLVPLGLVGPRSPGAVCGHSLGGRIALQYAHHLCLNSRSPSRSPVVEPPRHTWVLDSVPGRADPSVHSVLRAISSLPTPVPSKAWLQATLIEEHKMAKAVAAWIATNLRDRGDGRLGWAFDLGVANELVDNFADQDFAGMIRDITRDVNADDREGVKESGASTVHLVMAGRNEQWSEEVLAELRSIPSRRGSSPKSSFRMHTLEDAGHWVHVDDPDGLVRLMVEGYESR